MMIKKYRITLIGLVLITFLTSFGFAVTVESQSTEVLSIWMRRDPESVQPVLDAYNARLKAAGKHLQFEYTQVQTSDLPTKLTEAAATGQSPDLVGLDPVAGPRLSALGLLLDLTDRFNALDYREKINKKMLNVGIRNGKIYALPGIADVSLLVYNKKLFKTAGLDPDRGPGTWDELRSMSQKLTRDGVVGFELWCGSPGWLIYTVMPYAWANGGSYLSTDGTKAMLDDPKTIEAIQFLADLNLKEHVTAPSGGTKRCAEQTFAPAFEKGTLAIEPRASSSIVNLIHDHPELDLGVSLIPGSVSGSQSSFIGGDLFAIPATSKHPNEAWEAIQYILSTDVQVGMFAPSGFVPVRSDLVDNKIASNDPRFKVFVKALENGDIPWSPVYDDLYVPMQLGLQAALNGEKPVLQALTEANVQMQQVLDKR